MAQPAKGTSLTLNNGVSMPTFGLGTWKSSPGAVKEAVKYALLEAGYRHIDCALVYQNENEVGDALKEVFDSGALTRKDVFITSKCWCTYHARDRVMEGCKKTLANLGIDQLDLYLVHWPMGYKEGDELFPKDANGKMIYSDIDYLETWKGMEDVLKTGLTRAIGVSNFNSQQIQRILDNCEVKPAMNQVECHPYLNQQRLFDWCRERQIGITAYSPLGSPDRPWAKPEDPSLLEDPAIVQLAAKYSKSPAQILLRYVSLRGMFVIPKSVTPSRIAENINIFDFELTPEEIKKIDSFNRDWRAVPLSDVADHPLYPFNIPY